MLQFRSFVLICFPNDNINWPINLYFPDRVSSTELNGYVWDSRRVTLPICVWWIGMSKRIRLKCWWDIDRGVTYIKTALDSFPQAIKSCLAGTGEWHLNEAKKSISIMLYLYHHSFSLFQKHAALSYCWGVLIWSTHTRSEHMNNYQFFVFFSLWPLSVILFHLIPCYF